jgi:hypothetical protein
VVGTQCCVVGQQPFESLYRAVEPTLERPFSIAFGAEVAQEDVSFGMGSYRAAFGEETEADTSAKVASRELPAGILQLLVKPIG